MIVNCKIKAGKTYLEVFSSPNFFLFKKAGKLTTAGHTGTQYSVFLGTVFMRCGSSIDHKFSMSYLSNRPQVSVGYLQVN